ncbi:Pentatricopeptide repeat-containing protein [Actinidia chinensis var. chinensis]|uniref:Pentatricopeptide repeat-containing protein n=1 Tax=Actinidia chinensis var. chinensis TaxID=1590841 RepID=A0A2R6Q2L8_ACTCC|nr:Pentatricopeptide repeat-containing protein [Actinidia chinensis var. chinensis]
MWGYFRRRLTLSLFSATFRTHFTSQCLKPTQFQSLCSNSVTAFNLSPSSTTKTITTPLRSPGFTIFRSCFTSSIYKHRNADEKSENSEEEGGDDYENPDELLGFRDQCLARDVETILGILKEPGSTGPQVKKKLEQCSVTASSELVVEVLSRVRNDWELAFTFFLWAAKQPDHAPSVREYHSMISILAKMRKFDTAWTLIDEMRRGTLNKTGQSLVTPQTLLIMIRRYCAVHDVGKAINTFYAHKLFKFDMGMDEFHDFLSALCRYKNVKDAEHLLFCNENVFPYNSKSFNIILNGWCNIIGNPREAKRVWREMSERGIACDVISYSSIISCYSKFNNLHEVLKLFNRMKEHGVAPDRKVYNAVIHALAKGKRVKDACNMLRAMEEKGIAPSAVTYNSLIKPLCRASQLDEGQEVFHEMLKRGLSPTIRTYHVFFRILRTGEEVFALLEKMNKMGCRPNNDTYAMLLRKFCRWRQLDNVFKLWSEMSKNGGPDRSSYTALIHGLFLNGKLEEAYKYYQEMKEKQFFLEPKLEEMLQTWVSGKQNCKLADGRFKGQSSGSKSAAQ